MTWYDNAACRDEDPELFFPIGSSGPAVRQLQQAKRVCAGCPVQRLCLEWAVRTSIDYGVWGGLGEDERRSLKRRTARQRAQTTEPISH